MEIFRRSTKLRVATDLLYSIGIQLKYLCALCLEYSQENGDLRSPISQENGDVGLHIPGPKYSLAKQP